MGFLLVLVIFDTFFFSVNGKLNKKKENPAILHHAFRRRRKSECNKNFFLM